MRHGETQWNKAGDERFRGREDIDLNETGIRQATATAERIAGLQASAIYSSPLRRAVATAEILARVAGLRVKLLDGLVDVDYGRWQGLSLQEVSEQYGQLYSQWLGSPHQVAFPGGESLQDVKERALGALEEVLAQHKDQIVVLVSHQVVCKVLLCSLLGLGNSHFWQVQQDVCAINVFEARNGGLIITLINDTCHLGSPSFPKSL